MRFYDPKDRSPLGSSVSEIIPGKNTGVGCHFLLQTDVVLKSIIYNEYKKQLQFKIIILVILILNMLTFDVSNGHVIM